MASSFTRFLDHTQRRTTVGRLPLDEWSARRRDLYLTTHNTHNRQISMPPVGFEPTISAGERPQTYALDRAATSIGIDSLISQIYSWNETLHVSDSSSVHHQEFFRIRMELRSILILLASCQQTCLTYTIAVCVQWKTPDDGQRNCPKHVEFHSKNKFEKLVHLVGFIIREIR